MRTVKYALALLLLVPPNVATAAWVQVKTCNNRGQCTTKTVWRPNRVAARMTAQPESTLTAVNGRPVEDLGNGNYRFTDTASAPLGSHGSNGGAGAPPKEDTRYGSADCNCAKTLEALKAKNAEQDRRIDDLEQRLDRLEGYQDSKPLPPTSSNIKPPTLAEWSGIKPPTLAEWGGGVLVAMR